jgi:hypothetical protein
MATVENINVDPAGEYVVVKLDSTKYELTAGQAQQLAAALSMTAFKVTAG